MGVSSLSPTLGLELPVVSVVSVALASVAASTEDLKVVGIVRPALRAGDDVINLEHGVVASSATELAETIPFQNLDL